MNPAHNDAQLFSLHGVPIRLRCGSQTLRGPLDHLLGEFGVNTFPPGTAVIEGTVRLYEEAEVIRRLPSSAARLTPPGELTEVYQADEHYWLIDDRWGMAEINLLKAEWRSWIIPQPMIDHERCAELAILWPLSQLARGKGLNLVPAASAVRDGWGLLIVAQGSIEPELAALIGGGFRIVGQRWTAIREDAGRITMLRLPGKVERSRDDLARSRGRSAATGAAGPATALWVDLTSEFCGSSEPMAGCDAVFLVDRGRRPVGHLKALPRTNALVALRRGWPIQQLAAQRRLSQFHAKLARHCRCFEARFSRSPKDVLRMVEDARYNRVPTVEPTVQLSPSSARRVVA